MIYDIICVYAIYIYVCMHMHLGRVLAISDCIDFLTPFPPWRGRFYIIFNHERTFYDVSGSRRRTQFASSSWKIS